MGSEYVPRNKKVEEFSVNSWGRDLLGRLHEALGLPIYEDDHAWKYFGRQEPFHVPYRAKAAEAKMWGAALAQVPDERVKKIIIDKPSGWGGTQDEWVEWVRNWQKFLLTCSGYSGI